MSEQRQWRIYYGNGETFSDADGSPRDAPALDVQAIAQADETVGRVIRYGHDFYIYADDEWLGVDWFGLLDYLTELGIVKAGRMIPRRRFWPIYQRAADDPDFVKKTALHWLEQKPPPGEP